MAGGSKSAAARFCIRAYAGVLDSWGKASAKLPVKLPKGTFKVTVSHFSDLL